MSKFLKSFCQNTHKSKIREMCEKGEFCAWECEILLDHFCEPQIKSIEALEHSDRYNYYKRLPLLENRIVSFISNNERFFDNNFLRVLLINMLTNYSNNNKD